MFHAVTSNRMSATIVDQVRAQIRFEQLRPGDRLPIEHAPGDRMGVSRVTVRDALRVLEAGGLVESKAGARQEARRATEVDR